MTKPLLDEAKKAAILGIVGVGCSRRTAARYAGCSVSTIRNTALRDDDFARRLREAEEGAEVHYLSRIRRAAEKEQYWRAAAWLLERRNPRDYAPRRAGTVPLERLVEILREFARLVVDEVPVARFRQNIVKRLDRLAAGLDEDQRPLLLTTDPAHDES